MKKNEMMIEIMKVMLMSIGYLMGGGGGMMIEIVIEVEMKMLG